jgi:ATP-dependent DNA helicase RecQ
LSGGRVALEKGNEEEKYQAVRDLLEENNIIYVSRTRKAFQLAQRLSKDGFKALPYHGKMDFQASRVPGSSV